MNDFIVFEVTLTYISLLSDFIVSPAKQKRDIGIAFPASSSAALACKLLSCFLVKLCFSGTLRARTMKLGTSLHLIQGS